MTDDVTLPTPDEVAAMRERHGHPLPNGSCDGCEQASAWPCDPARLLALVDLRDKVAAVNRTFTAGVERDRDEARARLAAVLAECAQWEYVSDDTFWLDRIRRAATGNSQ